MEIRALNAGDLHLVGGMLANMSPKLVMIDMARREDEDKTDHATRVGKQLVPLLLRECYQDAWAWLADLCGMTVEEFNKQPIDAPMQVIEALVEKEDLRGFFSRAAALIAGK